MQVRWWQSGGRRKKSTWWPPTWWGRWPSSPAACLSSTLGPVHSPVPECLRICASVCLNACVNAKSSCSELVLDKEQHNCLLRWFQETAVINRTMATHSLRQTHRRDIQAHKGGMSTFHGYHCKQLNKAAPACELSNVSFSMLDDVLQTLYALSLARDVAWFLRVHLQQYLSMFAPDTDPAASTGC